ncbi:hypothetical protein P3T43_003961 [Paraburkholderia sp. GAS41]
MNRNFRQTTDELAELEAKLAGRYGQLMGSAALAETLGFASVSAFRQACWSGRIGIPMFNVPGRAGRFALTQDVVQWLWALRESAPVKTK